MYAPHLIEVLFLVENEPPLKTMRDANLENGKLVATVLHPEAVDLVLDGEKHDEIIKFDEV